MTARTLALKTKDVETRASGAGHALLEVYLNDLQKWIMVNPQFDAIVLKYGIPLNAVEIQQAVTDGEKLDLFTSKEDLNIEFYTAWIYPYLYYFDVRFDHSEGVERNELRSVNGKINLMLVPLGAP